MAMKWKPDDLETTVRYRGGYGRSMKWQWSVCVKGGAPIMSNVIIGAEQKAWNAAADAMRDLIAEYYRKRAKK